MKYKLVVQVVALVVVATFAIGILLSGDAIQSAWLKFYSSAVLVATSLLTVWFKWAWRWGWTQKISSVPVNLRGTWKGVLTSYWVDPSTEQRISPKPVFLVVRQTGDSVVVTMLTDESRSVSTYGQVTRLIDDQWSLDYMYLNTPNLNVRRRSALHHGSTSLGVSSRPARRLTGRYWTDRDSKGEIDCSERRAALADDFDEAELLFRDAGDAS